jgi:hypothetical protein
MALIDTIIGVESGGDRYAKNPRSSAYGPGQFISSTWLEMVRKYRPDLMAGRSQEQVLALRSDPAISREMTDAYARENSSSLKAGGFEPTNRNVYLSHFAGPAGAIGLLRNPRAMASDVLSPAAIKANPFLRNWTAQQVIDWAGGKMEGGGTPTADSGGGSGAAPATAPATSKLGSALGGIVSASGYPEAGGLLSGVLGSLSKVGKSSKDSQQQTANAMNSTVNANNTAAEQIINKSRNAMDATMQDNQQMAKKAFAAALQSPEDLLRLSEILQRRAMGGV